MKLFSLKSGLGPVKRSRGFTLPEMMVGLAIGALIMAAVASATVMSVRSFASMYSYSDMNLESRTTLDTMSKDLRGAANVVSVSGTSLVLNGADNTVISYLWDSTTETLACTRKSATATSSKTELTGCSDWKVTMYTKTRTITSIPAECKMVAMSWKCSRKVIGVAQSEDAQDAVIVLRNK